MSNGKQSAFTYLFKYLAKTHSTELAKIVGENGIENMSDKALKNIAGRFFFCCRGFNFFGLKGSITKFNFIQKNHSLYKNHFSKQLLIALKKGDYYTYLKFYAEFFENATKKINGKSIFIGVLFDRANCLRVETKKKTGLKDESVLIEKNQYCMFENTQDEEGEVFNVEYLDLESSRNLNVLHAYNAVLKKQENYDAIKNDYINSKKLHLNEEKQFKNEWLDRLVKSCMNLDNQDELLQLNNIIQEKTKPEPPWWQFLKKDDCDMCVVT